MRARIAARTEGPSRSSCSKRWRYGSIEAGPESSTARGSGAPRPAASTVAGTPNEWAMTASIDGSRRRTASTASTAAARVSRLPRGPPVRRQVHRHHAPPRVPQRRDEGREVSRSPRSTRAPGAPSARRRPTRRSAPVAVRPAAAPPDPAEARTAGDAASPSCRRARTPGARRRAGTPPPPPRAGQTSDERSCYYQPCRLLASDACCGFNGSTRRASPARAAARTLSAP